MVPWLLNIWHRIKSPNKIKETNVKSKSYLPIQIHWSMLRANPNVTPSHVRTITNQINPPYDPRIMAIRLGVTVYETTESNWSGAVRTDIDNKAAIWVKANEGRRRKRFTLAHELGHLLLHTSTQQPMFRDTSCFAGDARETEANYFAGELLMPQKDIFRLGPSVFFNEKRLADIFDVSTGAMSVRLQILGLIRTKYHI